MKTELKAKFLQHLNQKKQNEGFTLIELLVVIIIIGILAAIALPSFLNQANKARASEAKTYVGSANRAQQARFLEQGNFVSETAKFAELELGINTQTENYKYTLTSAGTAGAATQATPAKPGPAVLKGYVGTVAVGKTSGVGTGESTTLAVVCETNTPIVAGAVPAAGTPTPASPATTSIACGGNQKPVK